MSHRTPGPSASVRARTTGGPDSIQAQSGQRRRSMDPQQAAAVRIAERGHIQAPPSLVRRRQHIQEVVAVREKHGKLRRSPSGSGLVIAVHAPPAAETRVRTPRPSRTQSRPRGSRCRPRRVRRRHTTSAVARPMRASSSAFCPRRRRWCGCRATRTACAPTRFPSAVEPRRTRGSESPTRSGTHDQRPAIGRERKEPGAVFPGSGTDRCTRGWFDRRLADAEE